MYDLAQNEFTYAPWSSKDQETAFKCLNKPNIEGKRLRMRRRLTLEEQKKYRNLSQSSKDFITTLIIKESMTEQESYKFLINCLRVL